MSTENEVRQVVFNWLDTLETGSADRGAVQVGLVRDICRIAALTPAAHGDRA